MLCSSLTWQIRVFCEGLNLLLESRSRYFWIVGDVLRMEGRFVMSCWYCGSDITIGIYSHEALSHFGWSIVPPAINIHSDLTTVAFSVAERSLGNDVQWNRYHSSHTLSGLHYAAC